MFSHSPKIITDGLVLALDAGNVKSYTSGSTTWFDKSGFNNNGILTNGPTFNTGSLGSIVFDGVDDYDNQGTFPAYDFSNGMTLEATVNFSSLSGYWQRFFDFGNGAGIGNFIFGRYSTSNNVFFESRDNSGGDVQRIYYSTGNPLNTNQIATYSLTVPAGTPGTPTSGCLMYKNGLSIAGSNQNANYPRIPGTFIRSNSYIAKSNWADSLFQGSMYIIRIYNRTLSASEIYQNFNATKGRYGL